MRSIRHISAIITLMLTFISCGNKSRQAEPIIYDDQPVVERSDSDTTSTYVQNEGNKVEEKSSASVSSISSSSSRTHNSVGHDNMRGFDPASEDDMDDNGMSRYMENYDEKGWN